MQVIFDLPVIADKRRHLFRLSIERSDVELPDSFNIALNFTFILDHYYGFQPGPVVAFFEPSRFKTHRVTACLNAAVARIKGLALFYKAFPDITLAVFIKKEFDILTQTSLITFETNHVIGFLVHDLLTNLALAAHRIDGHDRALYRQEFQ